MAYLEVNNLIKKYNNTEVLKGISFTLNEGEVLSIIGSSGNGKTTILRCLNGLTNYDSGSIFINGLPISNGNIQNFGMVFQNFNLFPQYTALENVTLAGNIQIKEEVKNKKLPLRKKKEIIKKRFTDNTEKCKNILVKVGLESKLDSYPIELSGGQQQRVAIARALALSPKILCFDEPTSALDPELTREVMDVIKNLKSQKKTMIIVTHEMSFAKEISDKVIFISDGVIIEEGSPNEIFDNPKNSKTRAFLQKDNK